MIKPIVSLIVLILSIIFTFFYVVPAYNLNQTRRGDVETLTKILDTSGEIKTLIAKTKTNLSNIDQAGLSRFEVFLPERIDPIRFANNIQYVGRKNRIALSDIKVEGSANIAQGNTGAGGVTATQGLVNTMSLGAKINQAEGTNAQNPVATTGTEKKYVTTKASFIFTATFETFQLFLNDLEKSLGVINLTSLSFTPLPEDASAKKSKTPPPPTYQYTMAIETYSLK